MINLYEVKEVKNYLFKDIFDIDEIVRLYGNMEPEDLKEFEIKRSYFCYHLTTNGNYEKEYISKQEYEDNKSFSGYYTKLNYEDFEDKLNLGYFLHFITDTLIIDLENDFIVFAKKYINSSPNEITLKIRLKEVLGLLKSTSEELNSISYSLKNQIETNMIQKNIIKFFSDSYLSTFEFIKSFYKELVDHQFNNNLESKESNIPENPYPRIFVSIEAFHFFKKLKELVCNKERTKLADYSFVFRQMQYDKYIYKEIQESEFRNFLSDEYEIELGKLKTLPNCSPSKKVSLYNFLKN
jgi:hypothetical protein